MQDAQEVIQKIEEEAKTESSELRFVRTCEIGDEIRQGDVYLYPVDPGIVEKLGLTEKTNEATRQLAPGTTQGSRHIIHGNVSIYPRNGSPLEGPVLVMHERCEVRHPTHADVSFPSRTYEVLYPRDHEQEEINRIAD